MKPQSYKVGGGGTEGQTGVAFWGVLTDVSCILVINPTGTMHNQDTTTLLLHTLRQRKASRPSQVCISEWSG